MKWWDILNIVAIVMSLSIKLIAMPSATSRNSSATAVKRSEASDDGDNKNSDVVLHTEEAKEIGLTGNWIKKKDFLLKAYKLGDEINELAAKIQSTRKVFHQKYSAIDDELDDFYKSLGLEQGKLQELFDSVSIYLAKKKKKREEKLQKQKDSRTIKDRDYIINIELVEEDIKKHKRTLNQLKLDLKSVEELDKSLSARLKKLNEQIKKAADITKESKEKIEKLWNILDHTKARTIYFELKGNYLNRLNAILSYLNNDLTQDFDKVLGIIKTQMATAKQHIAYLEKQGLIIKDRAKRIDEIKKKKIAKKANKQASSPVQKQPSRSHISIKPTTWYVKIYNSITETVARVYKYFRDIIRPNPKK